MAKFKIIASTASCTCYTIDKERLKLVPDVIRTTFLDGLFEKIRK